jgi:hypothetical protein
MNDRTFAGFPQSVVLHGRRSPVALAQLAIKVGHQEGDGAGDGAGVGTAVPSSSNSL